MSSSAVLRGASALALALAAVSGGDSAVLLGRGDSLASWAIDGGLLSLSSDLTPWSGLPYLNVSYDFSQGGWSALVSPLEAAAALAVPAPTAVSFAVFVPVGGESMVVSLTDAGGGNRGAWPYFNAPGWHNITLPLAPNASAWLPRPANDSLPLPLRALSLGAGSGNSKFKVGWLGLADVALHTAAAPGAIPRAILMTLLPAAGGVGDGVFVSGSASAAAAAPGVVVVNRLLQECSAAVLVEARNSTGPMGEGAWQPCATLAALPPWTARALTCALPAGAPPGFVVVRATLSASGCWTVNDTLQVVESSVALVGAQPAYTPVPRNRRNNVFAGQMTSSPAAAVAIGMQTVRSGPMWDWSQHGDCWNASTCFSWGDYDSMFDLQAAGMEVMIDARADVPPRAAYKNGSGPTWASFPGPDHYADYQRWLTIMLQRYAAMASAVEVSNEQDGLAYFMPDAVPLAAAINWTLASINITAAAMAAASNASGAALVGLSSSMFDIKQTGNGGSAYMAYERAILSAPGVMTLLQAATVHPYTNNVWVPWVNPGWGNLSFSFFNESLGPGFNSSTAQILATAALMREQAAAAGLPDDYAPVLWPSEWARCAFFARPALYLLRAAPSTARPPAAPRRPPLAGLQPARRCGAERGLDVYPRRAHRAGPPPPALRAAGGRRAQSLLLRRRRHVLQRELRLFWRLSRGAAARGRQREPARAVAAVPLAARADAGRRRVCHGVAARRRRRAPRARRLRRRPQRRRRRRSPRRAAAAHLRRLCARAWRRAGAARARRRLHHRAPFQRPHRGGPHPARAAGGRH